MSTEKELVERFTKSLNAMVDVSRRVDTTFATLYIESCIEQMNAFDNIVRGLELAHIEGVTAGYRQAREKAASLVEQRFLTMPSGGSASWAALADAAPDGYIPAQDGILHAGESVLPMTLPERRFLVTTDGDHAYPTALREALKKLVTRPEIKASSDLRLAGLKIDVRPEHIVNMGQARYHPVTGTWLQPTDKVMAPAHYFDADAQPGSFVTAEVVRALIPIEHESDNDVVYLVISEDLRVRHIGQHHLARLQIHKQEKVT